VNESIGRSGSLVGGLAGVDPLAVDVDGFGQVVDSGLEVLQTDATGDASGVAGPVHLHLTGLLVITKGTVEERVQRLDRLTRRHRLSLTLAFGHHLHHTSHHDSSQRSK